MSDPEFNPIPGVPYQLAPNLELVLAANPSPMTGPGTNTFLLGDTSLAVIDPGPLDEKHLAALIRAINGRSVSHIIVTHSHLDHSPLARPLSDAVGAPIYAFGDSKAGRSDVMQYLADAGMQGGGEGIDDAFVPNVLVADGDVIAGDGWTLGVMHTPGHLGNHIALRWEDAVFVGDLVMGWSTSLVSPPDGDMTDFLMSCARLIQIPASVHYAGHGAPIYNPHQRLREVVAHRESRSDAILAALSDGPLTVVELVDAIYVDIDARLKGAAGRNVMAHLIDLYAKNEVAPVGELTPDARFQRR